MKQTERVTIAQDYRERFYSPNRKVWEMCIDYLSKYGSITFEEAKIAYGERDLATTVWYCRKKGFYIKTKKNPSNLKSYATFVLGSEEQKRIEASKVKYTHANQPRLWKVWSSMRGRCLDPKCDSYPHYGGRGITICDEWVADFQSFAEWALANGYDSEAPFGECTLDRIDNNGNYEPSNCRWVSTTQQQNNKSTNVFINYNGESHTIAEWSRITGIAPDRIRRRLLSGWSAEEALTLAGRARCKHITFRGVARTLSEWGEEFHLGADTINRRLKSGWNVEDALTKPVKKQKNNRYSK